MATYRVEPVSGGARLVHHRAGERRRGMFMSNEATIASLYAILESLSDGVPTLSDVAARMGMSARTLQRRLSDEGHSFQSLIDEARRRLA